MPRDTKKSVWCDAHCHLQDPRLAPHLAGVLRRAAESNVALLHVAATSEADWPAVRALAAAHPRRIIASYGLHPWYIANRTPHWFRRLREILADHPAGIGEIGLDGKLADGLDRDREAVFLAQLDLAYELGVPATIHCRDAWGPMLAILLNAPRHPAGLLIHAYSGPPDVLRDLAARNIHISFGGTLTRPQNHRAHENARRVPDGHYLLESDAPDLPPTLPPGRSPHLLSDDSRTLSEPSYVPYTGAILAELRQSTPAEIAAATTANAHRLFAKLLP